MGESNLTDHERPRLGDEVYKHPLIPQMIAMDPSDSLPRPVSTVSLEDTKAPALDPETMVCMGDESVFVVRDLWGTVVLRFGTVTVPRVRRSDDEYFVSRWDLNEDQLNGLVIVERELREIGALSEHQSPWLKVTPLRPQCVHYRRVMTDFQGAVDGDNKTAKQVERVCAAQRGESGEYVSLNNTRVYACEHRSPRDFVSEERLRRFDADSIEASKKPTEQWDLDAAEAGWSGEKDKDDV